jgi:hypothetical protein
MAFKLLWLPDVLKAAGLKVALVDGWEVRGRGDVGQTLGVICHHTANPNPGNMPTLETLIRGRSDLKGPLAQLGLGRDGTYYVIAAGLANHAGPGQWHNMTAGNTRFIGIEAEHSGRDVDPWPAVQMDAYQRGVAAILEHTGLQAGSCVGHKEWATKRKIDPAFDMQEFRANVARIMAGTVPAATLIPRAEPPAQAGASAGRATLRRGAAGPLVKEVQTKLRAGIDGIFGAGTEAAVRAFQRTRGMVPDGIVGPKTWAALDLIATQVAVAPVAANGALANAPWPATIASKIVASYLKMKFGLAPADLLTRNPPMREMPFFDTSAADGARRAKLGAETSAMLAFLAELQVPFETGSTTEAAQADLVMAMAQDSAPSSGMSEAINTHYRFEDEVTA